MNVSSWLKKTRNEIDSLDAELLLLAILHENERSFLVSHDDMELFQNDLDVLDKLVQLRKRGMPLAYILGEKEFYGRKFKVDRDVLIPRPESEDIIEIVKKLVQKDYKDKEVRILDVGTGSGCLGITLSLEIPSAKVVASDVSQAALKIASENAIDLGARVEFVESDLLDKFSGEKFDIIVANLPYLDENWDWLGWELEWEPENALFAEDGGLAEIKKLVFTVVEEKNARYLIIEADKSQHDEIIKFAKKAGLEHIETSGYQLVFRVSA